VFTASFFFVGVGEIKNSPSGEHQLGLTFPRLMLVKDYLLKTGLFLWLLAKELTVAAQWRIFTAFHSRN